MSTAFISHSHVDKPIARRLARRLAAYGIPVWLDERELRIGDALDSTIEHKIRSAGAIVVVASVAASQSKWVEKELTLARDAETAPPILPVFVENVEKHHLFANYLGVDLSDPHQFEQVTIKLAESLCGERPSPPAAALLKTDLKVLTTEEPTLALLIDGCLAGRTIAGHTESLAQVQFHSLDHALNTLYDLLSADQGSLVVDAAAHLFPRSGAGSYVLERHVATRDKVDASLCTALGERLAQRELATGLCLLSQCNPPDDLALAAFIGSNADLLSDTQRAALIRLVTYPRRTPNCFAVDAAFAALQAFPKSQDLRQLWLHWILNGLFDGRDADAANPYNLAQLLTEARRVGLPDLSGIESMFVRHVRGLARSADRQSVQTAVEHLVAATKCGSSLIGKLAHECHAARNSSEWNGWNLADEMNVYVECMVEAALTDHNWKRARTEYQNSWTEMRKGGEPM